MTDYKFGFSGIPAGSSDSDSFHSPPRRGKLLSFDFAELSGWIDGADGKQYFFSAGDVVGNQNIAVGQSVEFTGVGELAFEVTGLVADGPAQALRGKLLSFDINELSGWIHGDNGSQYLFSVADVVGDEEIGDGQVVDFLASGATATQVRQVAIDAPAQAKPLGGRLISFDNAELTGWIDGDDGAQYFFSAAEVVGDREIAVGERVSFSGSGESAFEVSGLPMDAPALPMRGRLLSFDASALIGWIFGDDGRDYSFSSADVVGDQDIREGQVVDFVASGQTATQIRGIASAPASAAASAQALRGKLMSFDAADMGGWIDGDDGAQYFFSAAEVVGDRDIAVGERVSFSGSGELAFEVTGLASSAPARAMRGRLSSFDEADLTGLIDGADGIQYIFSAADIASERDIAMGEDVSFTAVGEVAFEVTGHAVEAAAKALGGKLMSFDDADLSGWIDGEDGRQYFFSSADVVSDHDIAVGEAVTFTAVGETAVNVSGVATIQAAPRAMSGRLLSFDDEELAGVIAGDDGLRYGFSAADVVGDEDIHVAEAVEFSAAGGTATEVRRSVSHSASHAVAVPAAAIAADSARMERDVSAEVEPDVADSSLFGSQWLVGGLIAAVLIAALAMVYLQRQDAAPATPDVAAVAAMPPAQPAVAVEASPSAEGPAPAPVIATADAEVLAAEQPAPAEEAPVLAADAAPDAPMAVAEPVPVREPVTATVPQPEPASAAPVTAAPEPAAAPQPQPQVRTAATKPTTARGPVEPAPVAWWPAPRPDSPNLIFAGPLDTGGAIVLVFDSHLAESQDFASHIQVTRADGSRVPDRWRVGPNGRTLIQPVAPGAYQVAVKAELPDAAGRPLGRNSGGRVVVR